MTGEPVDGRGRDRKEREKRRFFRDLAFISTLGLSIPLCTVIGLGMGVALDKYVFGTHPWCTLIFTGLGIVAGFQQIGLVIRRAKKM